MNTIKDLLFALILLLAGVVCILLMQFTSFEIAGIGGVIFPLIGLVIAFILISSEQTAINHADF